MNAIEQGPRRSFLRAASIWVSVAAILGALLAVFVAAYPQMVEPPTSPQSEAQSDRPENSPSDASDASIQTAIEDLRLESSGWAAIRRHVWRLPAAQAWRVLSADGVSHRPEARQVQAALLETCLPILSPYVDLVADPTFPAAAATVAWCAGLDHVEPWDDLAATANEILQSEDIRASEARALSVDSQDAPSRVDIDLLRAFIADSENPFTVGAAVRSLLYYYRKGQMSDSMGFDAATPPQVNHVIDAATALHSCRAARHCTSDSLWGAQYCQRHVGLECASGQTLEQVIAHNLSGPERALLARVMARIASGG